MDWNDVRYFAATYRAGSLTGAARMLGVSVQTVGRRIDALETAIGSTLFVRHSGGYTATPDAEKLLARCKANFSTATDLADWLETEEGSKTPLADVGRALAKRNHGRARGIVLATTHAEAITGLRAIPAVKPGGPNVTTSDSPATQPPVWVLSGFGSQHRKMAKQLYGSNSVFAAAVDVAVEFFDDADGLLAGVDRIAHRQRQFAGDDLFALLRLLRRGYAPG